MKRSTLFERAPALRKILDKKRVRTSGGEEIALSSAITDSNAERMFEIVREIRPVRCIEIGRIGGSES